MMQQNDFAKVTAEQQAKWDVQTPTYGEVVIRKRRRDCAGQQVIIAVTKRKQLEPGAQILDTASSIGSPAVPLAKVLPHMQVISTDLAPSAREFALEYAKAEGVSNVEAHTADAQDLQAFSADTFAVVTCTYGLLFMPEYQKAIQEAYRVLQPGGLYVVTLWAAPEKCQMTQLFLGLAGGLIGPERAMSIRPPGIENAEDLPKHLQEAGFTDTTQVLYSHPLEFDMEDLIEFMVGPRSQFAAMYEKLKTMGRKNVRADATQIVKSWCEERDLVKDGRVTFNNIGLLYTAVKPQTMTVASALSPVNLGAEYQANVCYSVSNCSRTA